MVKWQNGVERNKRVLDEQISRGAFTPPQALPLYHTVHHPDDVAEHPDYQPKAK